MMKLTSEAVKELGILTTRDESGRHFTQWSNHWEELEEAGLIVVDRPVHRPTGIAYGQEDWSLEVTEAGLEMVEMEAK